MAAFMSTQWAQQVKAQANSWPDAERRASKLVDFWDWIDMVKPSVTGRLSLSVRDMPDGAEGDTLCLEFEAGAVTDATVCRRAAAEAGSAFLLAGSYQDWMSMLDGYDVGKMVMYRKLMLEKGDTLAFFTPAFFWTELLAAIQSVPAETFDAVPA
ncbi:MAG: hypothetical protein ACP5P1_06925 [Acidimicrobiales bacterium]